MADMRRQGTVDACYRPTHTVQPQQPEQPAGPGNRLTDARFDERKHEIAMQYGERVYTTSIVKIYQRPRRPPPGPWYGP